MKIKRLVEQHLITFAGGASIVDADQYNCTLLAENSDYYVYEIHDVETAQALGKGTDWGIALDDDTIAKQEWLNLFKTKCVIAAPDGKSEYFTPAKKVIFFIPKPPFKEKPYMLTIGSYQHGEPDKIPPFQFITYEDMTDNGNTIPPNVNFPIVNIDGIRVSKRRADDGQIIEDGELIDVGEVATKVVFPKGQAIIDTVCSEHPYLRSVTLPDSVRTIQARAFYDCNNLCEINFPDGLHTIEEGAFWHTALPTIRLPDSLVELGDRAFRSTNLSGAQLSNGLKELPEEVFRGCELLREVWGGDNLESIGVLAFENCIQLEKFDFGSKLQVIKDYAFENTRLAELILPDSISAIHSCAFKYCIALKKVKLPSALNTLGAEAFANTGLVSIEIPGTIRTFGYNVFSGCEKLQSVKINNGITELSQGAFMGDIALEDVDLGSSLVRIGDNAFTRCRALKSINLPSTARTIGDYAFEHCDKLEQIVIPNGLLHIGSFAFLNCVSLRSITLPSSLVTLDQQCFIGCKNLRDIYYDGTKDRFIDSTYARNVHKIFSNTSYANIDVTVHCKDGNFIVK